MVSKTSGLGISEAKPAISPIAAPNLAQTCGRAAEHMAEARKALGGESHDPDRALAHLDHAIACLGKLSPRGRAFEPCPESALMPFRSPKERRSA